MNWVWYEGVFELLQTITGKYRGGTQWGSMWIERRDTPWLLCMGDSSMVLN